MAVVNVTLLYTVDHNAEAGVKLAKFMSTRHLDEVISEILDQPGTAIEPEHLADAMTRVRQAGGRVDADKVAAAFADALARRSHKDARS